MYNYELSDEARQKLLEAASWAKAGLKITEDQQMVEDQQMISESNEYEQYEADQLNEDCEICPVCLSESDEPISEARLLEHLNIVLALVDRLQSLNESEEEDLESVVAEVIEENLIEEEDDGEDEDEDEDDEDYEDEDEDDEDLEEEEG